MSVLALALTALNALPASAVSVFFQDNGGSIDVLVDTAPEVHTFSNGTFGISVANSNPDAIRFTDAEVIEPVFFAVTATRWSGTFVQNLRPDGIDELLGVSVFTLALDARLSPNLDGPNDTLKFATIEYETIGLGFTEVSAAPISRPGAWLVSEGIDVIGDVVFQSIVIGEIPEPNSAILAGLTLLGFVARRRRR